MNLNSTWSQFQGDAANSGYIAVRTASTTAPLHEVAIADPRGAAPTVDAQRVGLYLPNASGSLISYAPNSPCAGATVGLPPRSHPALRAQLSPRPRACSRELLFAFPPP